MKTSLALVLGVAASIVSAGIVITPIRDDQIVPRMGGDCFFGQVTPQGCGVERFDTTSDSERQQSSIAGGIAI
ncbi:hypothetical protein MAC_00850 [Metarhizium acridum CQMa 102]|uniref:Uncharacterized protein n=1 Tax=Metarhizium acridum (strain CQMa 102) TaxID=655827 RepID=E9DTL2_METAQ|nr:uncharacterized protein MAC_00850 [Metarhizium acridum CQMa 102]EFY93067.1 hypothetical protein MAC_00850 [Metarhizium acridum CQMa 102]